MKYLILILIFAIPFIGKAQPVVPRSNASITIQDYRTWPRLNFILPRYQDTAAANQAANIGLDSCGAMISTFDNSTWIRKCNPKRWEEAGKNLGNSDLEQTSTPRTFDQNGGVLNFTGTGNFVVGPNSFPTSPFKFRVKKDIFLQNTSLFGDSTDGVELGVNNVFSLIDSVQGSGPILFGINTLRQRQVVPTGQLLLNNFWNGNLDILRYKLTGDSVRLHSQGGDFNTATKVQTSYEKAAGFTGRSVVSNVSENAIFQNVPSFLAKISTSGPASNNWIRLRGWNSSMSSYLLVNPFDTVDKYIGHFSTGNIGGRVLKIVDYFAGASGAVNTDSAYAFVAPFAASRNFFNGTLAIGGLADNFAGVFRPVDPSSQLDIISTTRGILIPRMNTTQQNAIATPATSLLIYNTDSTKYCYYTGSAWVCINAGGTTALGFQDVLSNNSLLSTTNEVDGGNFSFTWSNYTNYVIQDIDDFRITADSEVDIAAGDSLRLIGVDESATTGLFITLINPATGALTRTDASTLPITWSAISSPTADQALTFQSGESSTWTDQNTTEDLLTINNATSTTNSIFSLNRTSTALAAGNNMIELVSSGANGTNGITATGLRISVTNTNATSGTNVAFNPAASGATTTNWAIFTGTSASTDGRVGINNPTNSANHTLIVRSINNTSNAGILVTANNETQSNIIGYDGMRGSSGLIISTASGNIANNSAADITLNASANSSVTIDNNGQVNIITGAGAGMSVGSSSATPTGMIDITGTNSNTYGLVVRGSGYTTGGMLMNTSTSPGAGNNGFLYGSTGTIVEAGSGTHTILAGMLLFAPTITGGAATVTNTATFSIVGAPSTTVTGGNYSLFVQAGESRFDGNVSLGTGFKLNIGTGSNASIGVSAAMTAGTITISTTAVTSNSRIFLTHATLGGTQGILSVGTIVDGTSFVINSSSALDTGTVNWIIIN